MTFSARLVEHQFTPSEAAIISGVPVAQQRDWRRRDLIPGRETKGWSKFGATEIIDLAVMHFFTRAGIPPSSLGIIRRMATMPTLRGIHDCPGGVVLTGKEVGEHDQWKILFSMRPALTSHILVVATQDDGTPNVGRVSSYADIESEVDEVGVPNCIILDCHKLAGRLVERTAAPLIQIEISDRKTEPADEPQHEPVQ